MPKPIFDINEYELRGTLPEVYSHAQKKLLNKTLARVNGQIDWAAQLLGHSGPNYWGVPTPTADGSYGWSGLPETMNEKRQLQLSTFGVYNKGAKYENLPAPFNRSEIKASGDAKIHIFEEDGATILSPYGQKSQADYRYDPRFYAGAEYIFDQEIEYTAGGRDAKGVVWSQTFYEGEEVYTRVKLLASNVLISVKIKDSTVKPFFIEVVDWVDASDWKSKDVQSQFLGLWGSKGNSLSSHAAFDALDLHSFDERFALSLRDLNTPLSLEYLLKRVGLKPTEWTQYHNTKFGFKIGESDIAYPLPPYDPGELYDNEDYDRGVANTDGFLDNGSFSSIAPTEIADEGEYERVAVDLDPTIPDNFVFYGGGSDCNYELTLRQTLNDSLIEGIKTIDFEYKALEDISKVEFPCVEWKFDPSLDNGEIDARTSFPTILGPWATADDGEFDQKKECFAKISESSLGCQDNVWCGFNEGEFDKLLEPACDEPPSTACDNAADQILTIKGFEPYDDCACETGCCALIDIEFDRHTNFDKFTVETIAEDEYNLYGSCVLHDQGEYDIATSVIETPIFVLPDEIYDNLEYDGPNRPFDMDFVDNGLFSGRTPENTIDGKLYDVLGPFELPTPPAGYTYGFDLKYYNNNEYDSEYIQPPLKGQVDGGELGDPIPSESIGDEIYEKSMPPILVQGPPIIDYGPPKEYDCALDNGLISSGNLPNSTADSKLYDRTFSECEECQSEDQDPLQLCPVDPVYVSLAEIFAETVWEMKPSIRNSQIPLRIWKNRPLMVADCHSYLESPVHNFLAADENRGPEPEDNFRQYVRLPLEYARNGKDWNKAQAVCANQTYFSGPSSLSSLSAAPPTARPFFYSESYHEIQKEEEKIIYDEDFLSSTIRYDFSNMQEGFQESKLTFEKNLNIPFAYAVITDYNPFEVRTPHLNGEWRGDYFKIGSSKKKTGYLENDIKAGILIPLLSSEAPIYDYSSLKLPDIEFPDDNDKAAMKNFMVSYAYFAADFSAADDPVFDPAKPHCWRQSTITRKDPVDPDVFDSDCEASTVKSNTAYLLHT